MINSAQCGSGIPDFASLHPGYKDAGPTVRLTSASADRPATMIRDDTRFDFGQLLPKWHSQTPLRPVY
jgi:hypothetical protein